MIPTLTSTHDGTPKPWDKLNDTLEEMYRGLFPEEKRRFSFEEMRRKHYKEEGMATDKRPTFYDKWIKNKKIMIPDECEKCHFHTSGRPDFCVLYRKPIKTSYKPDFCKALEVQIREESNG